MGKYLVKPRVPILNRAHPLAKGLVACYPFFERGGTVLRDVSGRNNHGTLVNSPAWVRTPRGSSLNFDGANQYVNMPNKNLFTDTDVFSAEAWIRTSANGGPYNFINFMKADASDYLLMDINSTVLRVSVRGSGGVGISANGGTVNANTWYHIIVTYDGANVRNYINGSIVVTQPFTSLFNSFDYFQIGGRANDNYQYFSGLIDEVRIYNRVLSSKEITQLYANPNCIYKRPKIFSLGAIPEIVPPVLTNLTVTTGTNDGELNISFDYNEAVSTVPHCEIAIARINTDLPSGAHTGTETDSLVYNVFKPIYKTATSELPAMANNASGTYSVTLKLPDNGKVYITVSACDNSNNWANWMTAVSGTIKGIGGGGDEHSYAF